jgi:hypothetical protein
LNRHIIRDSWSATTPRRSVSSLKVAATPVGGTSLRRIAARAAGMRVRSSPDNTMPPLA